MVERDSTSSTESHQSQLSCIFLAHRPSVCLTQYHKVQYSCTFALVPAHILYLTSFFLVVRFRKNNNNAPKTRIALSIVSALNTVETNKTVPKSATTSTSAAHTYYRLEAPLYT